MFDVFVALLLVRALLASARGRSRSAVATSAALLLWAALAAAGWYGRGADGLGLSGAWLLALLGPSAVPVATPAVPFSAILADHPHAARLVLTGLLGAGFAAAWRHAGLVSPLSDEAVRRKDVGLAILAPALLVALQTAFALLATALPTPY
jgi:hypothetical protein